jgi:c-di-GMP-binding flagellar brake protein YcgR
MERNNPSTQLTSLSEIEGLLRTMQDDRLMVLVQPPGRAFSAVSMVLDSSAREGVLILDALQDESVTRKLLTYPKMLCESSIKQIRLSFEVDSIVPVEYEDRPALQTGFPTNVSYMQLRDNFRTSIPGYVEVTCAVRNVPSEPFRVLDISATGMALSDNSRLLDNTPGTVYRATLNLDDIGSFESTLRVVHSIDAAETPGGGKNPMRRVGLAFVELEGSVKVRVQYLVNRLQRAEIARERGMT